MRAIIEALLADWHGQSPTRQGYLDAADQLAAQGRREPALWPRPPRMLTATIDDGWGEGLTVIQALACGAGVLVENLGVLQPPETIVRACRRERPDLLGLTVLQFDSDDAVRHIVARLPPQTTLVAGGAAYRYDPDFAKRTRTPVVARNGAAFLQFLLNYHLTEAG
ncbi:MAG: cobalamin-dependent protein [Desulfobacterales bacterium]|nr:cobalamin-dependent protein [Desulfobacterales bacterium]